LPAHSRLLFLQQALAPGDTDAGDGIADNVQRGDEHLDGTVDGQNEGVGQQSAVVDEAHAGQDGEEDDGALLAYSLILAINRPIEMLVTSLNVVGDAVASICVAKSEGLLNEETFNA
jgi:hypothetical protein